MVVTIELEHFVVEPDRQGIYRPYFHKPGGKKVRLPDATRSPEFRTAYNAALAGKHVPKPPKDEVTAAPRPRDFLPPSLPPRGLRRTEAAAYIAVSVGTFDQMVREGVMPAPKRYGSRTIWDRLAVDAAFAALDATNEAATGWERVV